MHQQFIVCTLFFLSFQSIDMACAFSLKKCDRLLLSDPAFPTGFTSTTQFSSTFGPCSAFGKTKEQTRKLFYVFNWEFIKKDIAKGGGEDLSSLLLMSNCKSSDEFNLRSNLKMKYSELFINNMESSYHAVTDVIGMFCKMSS